MSDFYTKEELELFGGTAPSDEPFQQNQSVPGVNSGVHSAMDQNVQYQQLENAPQFVKDFTDPNSTTYKNVRFGASIANAVKLMIFGLIFAFVPLLGLFSVIGTLKTEGVGGIVALVPVLMISLFVIVGISTCIRGIKELIRTIKNK